MAILVLVDTQEHPISTCMYKSIDVCILLDICLYIHIYIYYIRPSILGEQPWFQVCSLVVRSKARTTKH